MAEKYLPLYLKHRPQSLGQLVGQSAVLQTLTNALDNDRISHAYLFTGPRGTGKTSSARILAKSLNCEKGPTPTPCLTCTACVEIREGNSPAVFEMDAASNNSVDDARTLIERAPLVAQGGRYKLYIIDECHMLTKEAFNALLKTIEEPPKNVVFILATTEEHKVPATIVSRCQRLMFRLVNQKELKEHLRKLAAIEAINIDDDALELIARRSAGGLRDALGLLDQASLLSSQSKTVAVADLLTLLGAVQEDVLLTISAGIRDKDGSAVLGAVHSLLAEGREPAVLIQELAKHFLNLAKACYNVAARGRGLDIDHSILGSAPYLSGLTGQAKNYDPAEIAQIVELLDKLEQNCRRSSQPALNLEIGVLSICHRHDMAFLKEVEHRLDHIESVMAGNDVTFTAASVKSHAQPVTASRVFSQAPAHAQAPAPVAASAPAPNATAAPVAAPAPSPGTPSLQPKPAAQSPAANSAPHTVPSAEQDTEVVSIVIDENIEVNTPEPIAETGRNRSNGSPARDAAGDNSVSATTGGASSEAPQSSPTGAASPPEQARAQQPPEPDHTAEDSEEEPLQTEAASEPEAPDSRAKKDASVSLDEIWSDLKDELQRRHMPAHGVVQTYAFPLSLEKDDLTIGVRKDLYLKMVENKSEHIKAAYTAVTGRLASLRVKVVNDTNQLPTARPKSSTTPSQKDESGEDAEDCEGAPQPQKKREATPGGGFISSSAAPTSPEFQSRGAQTPPSANRDQTIAPDPSRDFANAPASAKAAGGHIQTAPATMPSRTATLSAGRSEAPAQAAPQSPKQAQRSSEQPVDSGLIQEAYKLFEGPGSRLIG